jgi:type I restriction enzyme S subunit
LTFDSYINQSVVVLRANRAISSDHFLFFDMERRYEQFRQISDSSSSRGSLTTKLLGSLRAVLPPPKVVEKFDQVVGPLVSRISAGLHEASTLAALRDTLLPKLISGELRVKGAEQIETMV